ncbi:MAG: hypothetical protein GY710_06170 [Desulfobacteraceae bacterium]|nr:hypothetical protein [Desulfobacteraceae bacterium]
MAKPKKKPERTKNTSLPFVKMGAPRKYSHPDILEMHINEYVSKCKEVGKPLTMIGFACYADVDKDSLTNWMAHKSHDLFRPTKRLKTLCEEDLVNRAILQNNPTGAIFALKCNHGYMETNKTITEHKMFDPNEQASESVDNLLKSLKNDKQDQKVIDITPEDKE